MYLIRTALIVLVLGIFTVGTAFGLTQESFDVKNPKPHPEQLHKILANFELQPEQAIYVGDSELDERAARAAGVAFVAYANRALGAEFHIKRLKELEDILQA